MGIFEWFSSERRLTRKISKTQSKLMQRFGQSDDRLRAAQILSEIGGDEAVWALIQRFTFNCDKPTADMDEKQYVQDLLVDFGDSAIPLLKKFVAEKEEVVLAVRTLRQLQGDKDVNEMVLSLLDGTTSEALDPQKIQDLLLSLQDGEVVGGASVISKLLKDLDDTVRFTVVETLDVIGDPESRDHLLEALVSEIEESQRVRFRILEALQRHGWEVTGYRKAVEEHLPHGWYLDRSGRIKVLDKAPSKANVE